MVLHYVVYDSTGTPQPNAPSGCECPYSFMFSVDNFKAPLKGRVMHTSTRSRQDVARA